ncbi:hypothetical protein DBR43_21520 [Pedobacter sp. KBW06]|uniref:hypothetical protein n=1 Tax=Pedobacter sp. KBW06 TaxID=2153359 RepID=UPI000F5AA3BB|nr:hypothetical protein [Pedobacter sp. KBW06]RQO70855.1 hypothetical protein DBR43_21520 [Pedobacter sp. KBW06]
MKIELIPVIEIGYHNQNIKSPDQSPYWRNFEVWDKYNDDCYKKAGFKDRLIAYLPGSSFYRLKDISDNNLIKLTKDHTEEMRNGKYAREQASPFFGGYVLHIDGQDKYFPQCCSDLSVIQYWEGLLTDDKPFFYQGHPEPGISYITDKIIFDFTVEEFGEYFVPPPPVVQIEFERAELKEAIQRVRTELKIFANRIIKINIDEGLNIDDIDKLLIWGHDV